MPASHLITGSCGEEAAAAYLQGAGYRIVARNWRSKASRGKLELDIVCERGEELIFVEVKTRAQGSMQRPDEALTPSKQKKLITAAQHYLTAADAWQRPCRFDLVAVTKHSADYSVEHYEHAFDLSQPVGGSNTTWQPW